MDLLNDAQDKINDAELILCDLLNSGILDPAQTDAVQAIVDQCEALQIECGLIA